LEKVKRVESRRSKVEEYGNEFEIGRREVGVRSKKEEVKQKTKNKKQKKT